MTPTPRLAHGSTYQQTPETAAQQTRWAAIVEFDLFIALLGTRWSNAEAIVLVEICRSRFGRSRSFSTAISATRLARMVGADRSRLSTAIARLERRGIIAPAPAGGYMLVEQPHLWGGAEDDGERRTRTIRLEAVTAQRDSATDHCDPATPSRSKPATDRCDSATAGVAKPVTDCCDSATPPELNKKNTIPAPARRSPTGTHTHEGPGKFSPPDNPPTAGPRDPEDQEHFDAAIRLLSANSKTEHSVGYRLSGADSIPEVRAHEGWRYHYAARRMLGPDCEPSRVGKWNYYFGIVRNAARAEWDALLLADAMPPDSPQARGRMTRGQREIADVQRSRNVVIPADYWEPEGYPALPKEPASVAG